MKSVPPRARLQIFPRYRIECSCPGCCAARSGALLIRGPYSNASGALRREDANVCLDVIASAAKQSILPLRGEMDCFASLAMTARAMDCFAEPVIGHAFARPVGPQ